MMSSKLPRLPASPTSPHLKTSSRFAKRLRHFPDTDFPADGDFSLLDVTVGSALDLFGGKGLIYKDLVAWNQRHE
jgi:hypothetical protein